MHIQHSRCFESWIRSEINTNAALIKDQWRSLINGTENDWYLVHQIDYGSWHWIKWRLALFAASAFIALTVASYFDFYEFGHEQWPLAVSILYWICMLWQSIYFWFAPLFILFFIIRHISVLDDAIGLKKEVKIISIILSIINIVAFAIWSCFPFLPLIPRLFKLYPMIRQSVVLLLRILYIPINYMQTYWVVCRFGLIFPSQSGDCPSPETAELSGDASRSSAITLSTKTFKSMRRKAHKTTIRLIEEKEDSYSVDEDDTLEFVEMKRALSHYLTFDQFMRHLVKVSSVVYLQSCCFKELLHMWTWHHEFFTFPPEAVENGLLHLVQSPHFQLVECGTMKCLLTLFRNIILRLY